MAITPSEASVLKRANFGEVLTPIHKKLFFDAYNEKKPQYDKTFKVDSMDKKEATFPHLGAFGTWGENEEGNSFNHSAITEGDKGDIHSKRYDKAYDITWELVQDDQYNVFKGAGKGGGAQKLVKGLELQRKHRRQRLSQAVLAIQAMTVWHCSLQRMTLRTQWQTAIIL